MKNFILFFNEKEGTTAMVRILNKFSGVSVVLNENDKGNEPFNFHNSGEIKLSDFEQILDNLYGTNNPNIDKINFLYTKTSKKKIDKISPRTSVGHKMRFKPQSKSYLKQIFGFFKFRKTIIKKLNEHNVVSFIAVRKDTFRWALSKYHGSGKGEKGHLQFKLAAGKIKKEDIGKIHVKPWKFRRILLVCNMIHRFNRYIYKSLKRNKVDVYPLFYEDFLNNKKDFFKQILDLLEVKASEEEIENVVSSGTKFKKVNSDDISDFVENDKEVLRKFGAYYFNWK